MAQKSIKTYFFKGKSTHIGELQRGSNSKNATASKQIEQENASESKQPRMDGDAQKNHNEPSEMSSKQANRGKTRLKNPRGLVQGI